MLIYCMPEQVKEGILLQFKKKKSFRVKKAFSGINEYVRFTGINENVFPDFNEMNGFGAN